ncbi:Proteasome subunit alpha type-2 [Microbotryomycetes sp. JL221]|nr:Proteasome subunit alpha type-2 [Microbotryomycetes sp. JL221]
MAAPGGEASQYSFSLTTFSPSGKLVQIDHALAAVGQGTTSLGIKASNGIVIATSKKTPSPLVDDSMLEKVALVCPNIGVVYSGMGPDYRVLVAKARKLAQAYWKIYGEYPSTRVMVGEIANVMQEATQSGGVRPFGVSLLVAGFDKTKGHTLYQVDPSGAFWAWKASAIGKNQVNARTFLEKRYNDELSLEDAIHTALLTLKEGFEGVMTEKTIEIGIISTAGFETTSLGGHGTGKGDTPIFRKLSESEVADCTPVIQLRDYSRHCRMSGREPCVMSAPQSKQPADHNSGTDVFGRLRGLFKDSNEQYTEGGWDQAWKQGLTPWDSSDVQPALRELVDSKWDQIGVPWSDLVGKPALVAGCGRGLDATFFAARGLETVGMDLSETAIETAKQTLASSENPPSNVQFQMANFFDFEPPQNLYTLAYDYTFFCAIPHSLRPKWAQRYADVIRQGGLLITLEFPIDGDRPGGPPFSVSEEAYEQVLSPNFDKVYSAKPGQSAEGHEGREMIVVWKRK